MIDARGGAAPVGASGEVITSEHTAPTGAHETAIDVADAPGSVAGARRFVAERLTQVGLDELVSDAELVASELVTNALLHAGPPVRLVVHATPPRARVEVVDSSTTAPVRPRPGLDAMTGRGLRLVEQIARSWGVAALDDGKRVWAELEMGPEVPVDLDEEELLARWAGEEDVAPTPVDEEARHTVRLGDVPTPLLLAAKSHVDNLVREFTLAEGGASSGNTRAVSAPVANLIETVVHRFAEPREAIKRQAIAAAARGDDHVVLELSLPVSAAETGEAYLRALDEADAYCRAARLLTLESPPQHRIFRRWYVGELVDHLRRAAAGEPPQAGETFEERLLREIDRIAESERRADRAARLHAVAIALAAAATPEAVARAVLDEGVAALGASGGGVLLADDGPTLSVPGTVGYDREVTARLRAEPRDAALPAAGAMRNGESVWLESRQERDDRFPDLVGLEPRTVSMCAVPLVVGDRTLGALRFSFAEARLFDDDERSFIETMAAQTAQALERASLWTARADAALRLQRSLMPPTLPEMEGVTVSAAYRPVTSSLEVSGDFYDVWRGGERRLALAIGDVCGHGPEAASTTGLVRHTLRALSSVTTADLRECLVRLDRALADELDDLEAFATVVFGQLTIAEGTCWLDLASGGHPGPVVCRADGEVDIVEVGGSLLGLLDEPEIALARFELRPGDEVVLFTDGATDAPDAQGRWFGVEGVAAAASNARAAGIDTATAVSEAVLAHGGGELRDDLAVLTLRWDGPTA